MVEIEFKDIFEGLPKEQQTEEVESGLRIAYWRGVENHKSGPEYVKKRRGELLNAALKKMEQPIKKQDTVNILIRTSKNPKQFKRCIESVADQTYKNIDVITIVDERESLPYAGRLSCIINNGVILAMDREAAIKDTKKTFIPAGHKYLPHNTYFNHIHDQFIEGWVLVLDSDDMLREDTAIEDLMDNVTDPDTMYFFNMEYYDGRLLPSFMDEDCTPEMGAIGSPCFLWHTKYKEHFIWEPYSCGDYFVMKKMHKAIPNHKFLNNVVAKIVTVGSGNRKDNV